MQDNWEVIDMEQSLCGSCSHVKVCYRLREIQGLWEPLANFRVVVIKCDSYKGGISEAVWASIAANMQREEADRDGA